MSRVILDCLPNPRSRAVGEAPNQIYAPLDSAQLIVLIRQKTCTLWYPITSILLADEILFPPFPIL